MTYCGEILDVLGILIFKQKIWIDSRVRECEWRVAIRQHRSVPPRGPDYWQVEIRIERVCLIGFPKPMKRAEPRVRTVVIWSTCARTKSLYRNSFAMRGMQRRWLASGTAIPCSTIHRNRNPTMQDFNTGLQLKTMRAPRMQTHRISLETVSQSVHLKDSVVRSLPTKRSIGSKDCSKPPVPLLSFCM